MMKKLQICRICLVKDVRMYAVLNKNLHQLYEKLTDVPFVTEDSRPMLACFFCCAKLKQCWRFQRKCLEAEELFTQMMNEGYEQDPLISQGLLSFYNRFTKTPVENINVVGACQTESDFIIIKEELPDVSEPKEEHQTYVSELGDVDNSYPAVEATSTLHAESHSGDAPLLVIKTEVEVEIEPIGSPVAKKPKLNWKTSIPRDTIPIEHIKNENNTQLLGVSKIETAQNHTNHHGVNKSFNNTALGINSRNKRKRVFRCCICQKVLTRKRNLKNHMLVHSGEKPFKCEICPKSYTRKDILQSHMRDHADQGPFECEICQKSFDKLRYLKSHFRLHTGAKPYKCTICQQKFNQKSEIVTHMRVHTGEKPFKCDICQRGFTQVGVLTQHMRVHTGEKPFKCDICGKCFTQKGNLLTHIRSHTGEKPYKCDMCEKSFSKKNYLIKHTCGGPFVIELETEVAEKNQ